jgi:hypothetical protein
MTSALDRRQFLAHGLVALALGELTCPIALPRAAIRAGARRRLPVAGTE